MSRQVRSESAALAELWAIDTRNVPKLTAYRPLVRGTDLNTVAGRLSFRLQRRLPGRWAWTWPVILTDSPPAPGAIESLLDELWQKDSEGFGNLQAVNPVFGFQPAPQNVADFAARALARDLDGEINSLLSAKRQTFGRAVVERAYELRGWVVDGKPALSISVESNLLYLDNLNTYVRGQGDQNVAVGLWAKDRTSGLKGEVVGFVGVLREHRRRIASLSGRDEVVDQIMAAPDEEPVYAVRVRLAAGPREYSYVASLLQIVLRTADFRRFGIDGRRATGATRIAPAARADLVRAISKIVDRTGWLGDGFNTRTAQPQFLPVPGTEAPPRIRFGHDHVEVFNERRTHELLKAHGVFRRSHDIGPNSPIKIAVADAVVDGTPEFLQLIRDGLAEVGFSSRIAGSEQVSSVARATMEPALRKLIALEPHVILGLLPDEADEDEEELGAYHHFTSIVVGQGVASQIVYRDTMANPYALANILLGILAKSGNIPFVLEEPLKYADIVVGLDIARRQRERHAGSVNAAAVARIYLGNGELVRYVIHDAPLEGETIPENVLNAIFPSDQFTGKRVIVHRDGRFRGREAEALTNWGRALNATFHPVEVMKSGAPRLYGWTRGAGQGQGSVVQPAKGMMFRLSDREAFVVSSPPPFSNATAQPLQVRSLGNLSIDDAVHSVLTLTHLHHGSLRPPRLPVTIHYADRIAYLALDGIKPRELTGTRPYWL